MVYKNTKLSSNLAKLDDGFDGSPSVMDGEKQNNRKLGKNRGILKHSSALLRPIYVMPIGLFNSFDKGLSLKPLKIILSFHLYYKKPCLKYATFAHNIFFSPSNSTNQ
jgi:hypothetical protein